MAGRRLSRKGRSEEGQSAAPGVLKSERRRGSCRVGGRRDPAQPRRSFFKGSQARGAGSELRLAEQPWNSFEDAGEPGVQNEQTDEPTNSTSIFLVVRGGAFTVPRPSVTLRKFSLEDREDFAGRRKSGRKEWGTAPQSPSLTLCGRPAGMSVLGACPPFAAPHIPEATPHHPDIARTVWLPPPLVAKHPR